jgi:GNAT superfamily N-acetyltransferase
MSLKYTTPFEREPGTLALLLRQSYADLLETEPEFWRPEIENWEQFDREVFQNPDTVGACTFLSWWGSEVVGFFSFDPRGRPALGIIGHNCILPGFRRRGLGKKQIYEIIRRFRQMGIRRALVTTNDHPFFIPARRMYLSCGFQEVAREPWTRNTQQNIVRYEMEL